MGKLYPVISVSETKSDLTFMVEVNVKSYYRSGLLICTFLVLQPEAVSCIIKAHTIKPVGYKRKSEPRLKDQ